MSIDLLVAGGGPVGLGTAITAALAGMDVALVEPRRDPIDKACGEGLMPSGRARLAGLGVFPDGLPFAGIRYLDTRHRAEARFGSGQGLGVRRTVLHEAMTARADALGVKRVRGRVEAIDQGPEWVESAGFRARWLAAADGLHSPIRRTLGLEPPRRHTPPRFGLRRHYPVEPWTDLVEVHWAQDAEAYVTPVGPRLIGVALLCSGGAPYDRWLSRFPALAQHLAGAEGGPVLGAGPLRQWATARRSGRSFLVGDAAGYVDALTGEGIAIGLREAAELIECLVADTPDEYEGRWRETTRRYRALTSALVWSGAQPRLRPRIVPAAARFPSVFTRIVASLG